jgi:hypothetical protein
MSAAGLPDSPPPARAACPRPWLQPSRVAGLVSARLLAAKREVMMAGGKGVEGGENPDYGGGAKGDRVRAR